MFQSRTEYDRSVTSFSPQGRIFQVEYAIEAIKLGSTAIGIRTDEGVVLAVEKRLESPLLEPSSIRKIVEIDRHVGAAQSGLIADAKTLIDRARVNAQSHTFTYEEPIPVRSLTQGVCDLALSFGEGGEDRIMSRPFGVALLIAGCDDVAGPQLYTTDPSGNFVQYKAKAIGSASEGSQKRLEQEFDKDMTLETAQKLSLDILKDAMEEKMSSKNIEIALVTPKNGFKMLSFDEIDSLLANYEGGSSSASSKESE